MSKGQVNLIQVTHDLEVGGLQQVVVNLCRNIDRDQFHVKVLCLRALGSLTGEIEKLGIPVTLLPQLRQRTDYLSFVKVAKFFRIEKADVIHTHNTQPFVDGTIGAILSGRQPGVVHTDHARVFPDKKRYMFAEWCCSHFAYKVVGVSDQTTGNLRQYENISQTKLLTIENGIDEKQFAVSIDCSDKRRALGLPPQGPVIGVASRLEKIKGIKYLLRAMPEIVQRCPGTILLIVGEGTERENLEYESRRLGLCQKVIFTGKRFDVPEILKLLSVFLIPSLSEGLPLGLLEAMASSCPVVASKVGGIPGVVENGKTALLVSPKNSEEIATAVVELLHNHSLRERIARESRLAFGNAFSAKEMTNKYMQLYGESLLRRNN